MHGFWTFGFKCFNAIEKFIPGSRWILSRPRVADIREHVVTRFAFGLPDRRYWEDTIMPALLGAGFQRILFVGCGSYTRHLHARFEAAGIECWTTDIMADNARWGNPGRHWVCDIADIRQHAPANHFDAVLFNGVMGYGVTGADMDRIAPAFEEILREGGLLLTGWNRGLVEDPLTLPAITGRFQHGEGWSLPARKEFSGSTHVFDVFTRRPRPA